MVCVRRPNRPWRIHLVCSCWVKKILESTPSGSEEVVRMSDDDILQQFSRQVEATTLVEFVLGGALWTLCFSFLDENLRSALWWLYLEVSLPLVVLLLLRVSDCSSGSLICFLFCFFGCVQPWCLDFALVIILTQMLCVIDINLVSIYFLYQERIKRKIMCFHTQFYTTLLLNFSDDLYCGR
jgi:hypothetical protein